MAGRIVATEFVSLDGVMEAPGGEPDFEEQPERRSLRLRDSRVVGESVAVLIYERAACR